MSIISGHRKSFGIVFLGLITGLVLTVSVCSELSLNEDEDVLSPDVSISSPTNGQEIGQSIQVSGTVYDKNKINSAKVYYRAIVSSVTNSTNAVVEGGELSSFTAQVAFPNNGFYYIWAEASNEYKKSGKSKVIVVSVKQELTDTTPPVVNIIYPENGQNVGKSYNFYGTATDDVSGVAGVFVGLNNEAFIEADLSGENWSRNFTLETSGTYTNYVYAVDNAGNVSATNFVTVNYVEGTPSIEITYPPSGTLTNVSSLDIGGNVSIEEGFSITKVQIKVNDGAFTDVDGVSGLSWNAPSVALSEGTNRVRARAVSDNQKTNTTSELIIISDTTRPTIAILSPEDAEVLYENTVTISGTAGDALSGLEGVYLAVNDDGFAKISSSSPWSLQNINLDYGEHTVRAYSRDNAGNHSLTNSITFSIVEVFVLYFRKPNGWNNPAHIYYWPGNPPDDYGDCGTSSDWPGEEMESIGGNWYRYIFDEGGTKTWMVFNNNGEPKTDDLYREGTGWYWDGVWYDEDPRDTEPPQVVITYPSSGATLSGIETLTVDATDNVAVAYVEYFYDGKKIGQSSTAPFSLNWNTAYIENGTYTLVAKAHDTSYNYAYSQEVAVTTDNEIILDPPELFMWDNATVYFVITDRFYDGNPANNNSYGRQLDGGQNIGTFHGGDLEGLTYKLNEGYFTNLGVTAIWITAPYEQIHGWVEGANSSFKHYAYHGYYVLDYTLMDDNMGTTNDLKEFIDTAHSQGIRVIFDIVINHSGYPAIADLDEFGVDVLYSGWENYSLGNYHNYINYDSPNWADWWSGDWVRAGFYGGCGGDDYTQCLAYLPDFRTESTAHVGLPPLLQNKPNTRAVYIPNFTVRDYLITWLTNWVGTYGVDGFRCDTAKHVELPAWQQLKNASVIALENWKAQNPDKALDNLPFWMTGEVWGHGVGRSEYFDNGFDSIINFSFQGDINSGIDNYSGIEGTYSGYANAVNNDDTFNVLSYISSHDTSLFFNGNNDRQKRAGTLLLLAPGAVQIFYGDEISRPFGPTGDDPDQGTRSFMNWGSYPADVLEHWGKAGRFRRRHVAIGAGSHTQISSSPYTFKRVYDKNGITDRVICVLGASGSTVVNVSGVFGDGTLVRDYYSGNTATVSGGNVTFTPQTDILLLEEAN
jgi:glycosidase